MNQHRPAPLRVAVVLLVLLSIWNLAGPLGPSGVPKVVVISGVVFGIAGLIAVAGLRMGKRWAFWLAVIVAALNAFSAAPGIPGAPTLLFHVAAAGSTIASIMALVLLFLPTTRRALSPAAS